MGWIASQSSQLVRPMFASLFMAIAFLMPGIAQADATKIFVAPVQSSDPSATSAVDCKNQPTPADSPSSRVQQVTCWIRDTVQHANGFTVTDTESEATYSIRGHYNDAAAVVTINAVNSKTDAIVSSISADATFDATTFKIGSLKPQGNQTFDQLLQPQGAAAATPLPAVSVAGSGILSAPHDTVYAARPKAPEDFAKIVMIAIEGYNPTALNLDPQVAYAFNSFRHIYAQHQILALPFDEPRTDDDVKKYCTGALGSVPVLHVSMTKDQRTNNFLDAIYTGAQLDAFVKECSEDKTTFVSPMRDNKTHVYTGGYRTSYQRNIFAGIQAGAAYSSSPFITKYKSWLLFPLAFLGSFAHETQNFNGTVYCAAVVVANQHLADIKAPMKDSNDKDITPQCSPPRPFGAGPLNL